MRALLFMVFLLAQHTTPGKSPEEECINQCHIQHCTDYIDCVNKADPVLCRRGVNEKEAECFKQCKPERI